VSVASPTRGPNTKTPTPPHWSAETREGGAAEGMVKRGEISSICLCYVAPADTALQGESWEQALTRAEEVGVAERKVEQRLGR
jgi:hypothetical protein